MQRIWAVAAAAGVLIASSAIALTQHSAGSHASAAGGGAHFSSPPHVSAPSGPSHASSPASAPHSGYAPRRVSAPPIVHAHPPVERPAAANPHSSAAHASIGTRAAGSTASLNRPSFNQRRPGRGVRFYQAGFISPLGWWLGPWQFYPWLDADLSYDYWHDTGDQDTAIAMASTGANAVADADPAPYPNGGDPYADSPDDAPANWTATQVDTGAPALTLVYKTGKTEQVANYVISHTAVTVIDSGGVRNVPVADLDLAAMAKANAQSGLQMP